MPKRSKRRYTRARTSKTPYLRGLNPNEAASLNGPVIVKRLDEVIRTEDANSALDHRRYASHTQRKLVLIRDKYRCRYCGTKVTMDSANIDHVEPWIFGGRTELDNLVASCRNCNKLKGNNPKKPRRIGYPGRKNRKRPAGKHRRGKRQPAARKNQTTSSLTGRPKA